MIDEHSTLILVGYNIKNYDLKVQHIEKLVPQAYQIIDILDDIILIKKQILKRKGFSENEVDTLEKQIRISLNYMMDTIIDKQQIYQDFHRILQQYLNNEIKKLLKNDKEIEKKTKEELEKNLNIKSPNPICIWLQKKGI